MKSEHNPTMGKASKTGTVTWDDSRAHRLSKKSPGAPREFVQHGCTNNKWVALSPERIGHGNQGRKHFVCAIRLHKPAPLSPRTSAEPVPDALSLRTEYRNKQPRRIFWHLFRAPSNPIGITSGLHTWPDSRSISATPQLLRASGWLGQNTFSIRARGPGRSVSPDSRQQLFGPGYAPSRGRV